MATLIKSLLSTDLLNSLFLLRTQAAWALLGYLLPRALPGEGVPLRLPATPGHTTRQPSACSYQHGDWASKSQREVVHSHSPARWSRTEGSKNHLEPQQLQHPGINHFATSTASSETARFPVVSALLPSATLYCKQRATQKKAPWCPISGLGAGGGKEADCVAAPEGNIPVL